MDHVWSESLADHPPRLLHQPSDLWLYALPDVVHPAGRWQRMGISPDSLVTKWDVGKYAPISSTVSAQADGTDNTMWQTSSGMSGVGGGLGPDGNPPMPVVMLLPYVSYKWLAADSDIWGPVRSTETCRPPPLDDHASITLMRAPSSGHRLTLHRHAGHAVE
jgi:hypothetical protein